MTSEAMNLFVRIWNPRVMAEPSRPLSYYLLNPSYFGGIFYTNFPLISMQRILDNISLLDAYNVVWLRKLFLTSFWVVILQVNSGISWVSFLAWSHTDSTILYLWANDMEGNLGHISITYVKNGLFHSSW